MSNTINMRARRTRRSPGVASTPTPEPVVTREELERQSRAYTAGNMESPIDALRPSLDQAQRAWDNINRSAASLSTPQETIYQAEVQVAPNTIPMETIHRGLVDDIMRSIPYEELKKLFPIERMSSETLSGNFISYRAKFKTIKRRRNGN